MCGIGGYLASDGIKGRGQEVLHEINRIQKHRGPDGQEIWQSKDSKVGLAHARLTIIDLESGSQPMAGRSGSVICFNGEVYNYIELKSELPGPWETTSDTEVVLRAYEVWGPDCVKKLRGMYAFAIWDPMKQALFVARDRFGIKPFYFFTEKDRFFFSSEVKGILPFKEKVDVDIKGLRDYFAFQFYLGDRTLFKDIQALKPAHCGYVNLETMQMDIWKYWEVDYKLDWAHTERYFVESLQEKMADSVDIHLRSDVEIGAYVSGGVDSSLVASMARELRPDQPFKAFTGKFSIDPRFDESRYAQDVAKERNLELIQRDIVERDFVDNISKIIYHLDYPVAGPGSFPQYMMSQTVQQHLKVVLGGQGGDETFGGYARYLIAYFEQCIKGAIEGTMSSGNFVVSYESIIPNLRTLREYKPLIQEFWSEGIFDDRDKRYYRLINRSNTMDSIIDWSIFNGYSSFDDFKSIYWGENVGKESYFDSMTHFDFKTLLPALLHVEDRMSMAHSVESRVPMLDTPIVELAATVPADVKFQNGELKRLLRIAFSDKLPQSIVNRRDKMGFPTPLNVWMKQGGDTKALVVELLNTPKAKSRPYLKPGFNIEKLIETERAFSRNIWALLSSEIWHNHFIDNHTYFLKE